MPVSGFPENLQGRKPRSPSRGNEGGEEAEEQARAGDDRQLAETDVHGDALEVIGGVEEAYGGSRKGAARERMAQSREAALMIVSMPAMRSLILQAMREPRPIPINGPAPPDAEAGEDEDLGR